MEKPSSSPSHFQRILKPVSILLAGLIVAIAAVFIFKIAVGTVVNYGIVGLLIFSYLFNRSLHGSRGTQPGQGNSQIVENADSDKNDPHIGHDECH